MEKLRKECESSNLSAQKLKEELELLKSRYESGSNVTTSNVDKTGHPSPEMDEMDRERAERRRKKREAAMQDVLRRLEKLTIGGEEIGNAELKKRREKRRKRLETLVGALEANDANGSVFQVYGQLRFVVKMYFVSSRLLIQSNLLVVNVIVVNRASYALDVGNFPTFHLDFSSSNQMCPPVVSLSLSTSMHTYYRASSKRRVGIKGKLTTMGYPLDPSG